MSSVSSFPKRLRKISNLEIELHPHCLHVSAASVVEHSQEEFATLFYWRPLTHCWWPQQVL